MKKFSVLFLIFGMVFGCSSEKEDPIECVEISKSVSDQCLHHYERVNGEYTVIVTGCYSDYKRVVANFISSEYSCSNGETYKTYCMASKSYVTEDNPEYDYVCRLNNVDYEEFSSLNLIENDPMNVVVNATNTQDERNNKDYSQMKQLWIYEGFNIQL